MIIVNLSHPLTTEHQAQLAKLSGLEITKILDLRCVFDTAKPLVEQVCECLDDTGMTAEEWQTEALMINLPGYNPAAAVVIAELHGRMGYFPAIVRMHAIAGCVSRQFEVAEIINLQAVRDNGRARRR
jgi:hypothetical protein